MLRMHWFQLIEALGVNRIDSGKEDIAPDRVVTTNKFGLIFLGCSLGFIPLLQMVAAPTGMAVLLCSISLLTFVGVLVLNSLGQFDPARFVLVLGINLSALCWSMSLGADVGLHHFVFALTLLPLIIFEKHKRFQVGILTPTPIIVYTIVQVSPRIFPNLGPMISLSSVAQLSVWGYAAIFCHFSISYLVMVLQNQYEQQLEELRKVSEARAEFLQSMSHEIRTPMNSIIGLTDLLINSQFAKDPELLQFLKTIHSSGETLLAVVDDVLDIEKIEAGKLTLYPTIVPLRSFVEDIVVVFAAGTDKKGVELILEFEVVGDGETTYVDGVRLRQVLNNLLGNAVKFTEHGEITVTVKKVPPSNNCQNGDLGHLIFEVADSGIGIPQSELPKLFTNFFQVEQQAMKRFGGTGLGLAISKQLIHLMGGTIGVNSVEGKGSTFWFTIPLVPHQRAGYHTPQEPDTGADSPVLRNKVAWAFHPNFKVQQVIRNYLEKAGVVVSTFSEMPTMDPNQEAPDFVLAPFTKFQGSSYSPGSFPQKTKTVALVPWTKQITYKKNADLFVSFPLSERSLVNTLAKGASLDPNHLNATADHTEVPLSESQLFTRPVVLLAEDNPVNQEVMKMMLDKLSVDCEIAWNGVEVLELYQQRRFSLVFMDLNMPKMTGIEATKAIRKMEEESGDPNYRVPIIATTASVTAQDRERCSQVGMNDFLSKPIRFQILQELLRRYGC